MNRYLGIDYGEKRVGIAISDPFKIIAKAYKILENNSNLISNIIEIIDKEKIEKIIIGIPYNMNGSVGFQAEEVLNFIDELSMVTNVPIIKEDERLSSKKAKEIEKDLKTKSKHIDDRAAAVILQNFLDY